MVWNLKLLLVFNHLQRADHGNLNLSISESSSISHDSVIDRVSAMGDIIRVKPKGATNDRCLIGGQAL